MDLIYAMATTVIVLILLAPILFFLFWILPWMFSSSETPETKVKRTNRRVRSN